MTDTAETTRKRPGRKPKDFTESQAFKDAVAKATSDAVAGALTSLQGGMVAQSGGADQNLLNGLAVALAEIGSQGTGKKVVPPAVLKQRQDARDRMVDLILAARAAKQAVTYRLTNKVVLNERLIEPFWVGSDHTQRPTEIDWLGIPNEAMLPVSEAAKAIHAEFLSSLGNYERPVRDERLGVTRGGLVVRNGAVTATMAAHGMGEPRAEAPHTGDGRLNTTQDEGLKVHHETAAGRYKPVHVLGTIQEPAQQTI